MTLDFVHVQYSGVKHNDITSTVTESCIFSELTTSDKINSIQ